MATYDVALVSSCEALKDGADAVAGRGKQVRVTFSGTFSTDNRYHLSLGDRGFGYQTMPAGNAVAVLTHKDKLHAIAGSTLYYSGLGDATAFDRDGDVGAGFINMANHDGLSAALTGLAKYQEDLAVFARRVIQIWFVDQDDANNAKRSTLSNTGTYAPRSIVPVGDHDVYYLSDSGVRSLRARDSSNSASVHDVGTKIDSLILEYAATLTDEQRERAIGIVDPIDGRYWLALGERIFVFTYFPAEKVIGWSWYEPGFEVDDMAVVGDRLYIRDGDIIYLYGGASGDEYDDTEVTVTLPFLTLDKPADRKYLHGIDLDCEGEWDVEILVNPLDLGAKVSVGAIPAMTYGDGGTPSRDVTTHFAPRLRSVGSGYHSLTNLCVHFAGGERKG